MRAKTINEVNQFERGGEPKDIMGTGDEDSKIIKLSHLQNTLSKLPNGVYCLYIWETDSVQNIYAEKAIDLLKEYEGWVRDTLELIHRGYTDAEVYYAIYKIDFSRVKTGKFIDEKGLSSYDAVDLIFGIQFQNEKIIYYGLK